MKKTILAAVLALSAIGTASAREVSATGGYDFSDAETTLAGLAVSENYGAWGVTLGYDRSLRNGSEGDRVSLVVSKDLGLNVKGFPVLPKVGGAFVNPDGVRSGYAWLVGVGTRYNLSDTLSVGLDYRYQVGENDVRAWDGNQALVSVNYKF